MLTATLFRGADRTFLELVASDFNRQRWMVNALRGNEQLGESLRASAHNGRVMLIDSTKLIRRADAPPPGTHMVLWDGLNSLLELQEEGPVWLAQAHLVPVCVGMFPETCKGLLSGTLPLFDQQHLRLADGAGVAVPLSHSLRAWAQVGLRPLQNWRLAPDRHRLLKQGGQIVFCGLVQPSEHVLMGLLRGSQLAAQAGKVLPLVHTAWLGQPHAVQQAMAPVLALLQQQLLNAAVPPEAADWACAYSLVNVMQRMAVLSVLSTRTTALFVNEYAKQQHLDPYDAVGYRRNVFIDFGSTRGPDAIYPRTADLLLNGKPPLSLRFLQPGQLLAAALAAWTPDSFWAMCVQQADAALAQQAALAGAC